MLRIIGLFVRDYVGADYSDDEEWNPIEQCEYNFYVVDPDTKMKYVITLTNSYGMCPSGYSRASWGYMDITQVAEFGPFNYIPKNRLATLNSSIEYVNGKWVYKDGDTDHDEPQYIFDDGRIENDYFYYSKDGGDGYYPWGGAYAKPEQFVEVKRNMSARPVWIFSGDSGLGKTTLALSVTGRTIFETDHVEELPEVILDDIIVIGNKNPTFTKEEVIKRLFGNPKVIYVDFSSAQERNDIHG